jgi:hypothetical protein
MARYQVTIPIAGAVVVEVDADSRRGAITAAIGAASEYLQTWTIPEDTGLLVELEAYETLTSGNVLHVPHGRVQVTEKKGADDADPDA